MKPDMPPDCWTPDLDVSIPKRVSEALKHKGSAQPNNYSDVSIPKRVSEALKRTS